MSMILKHRQEGIVSITVTIIFILVISLIVLGFSQVTRRNSREALDRQLSSQALYAAETGVNDAISQLYSFQADDAESQIPSETSCSREGHRYMKNDGKVGDDPNISYTCLTVDANPPNNVNQGVGDSKSYVARIKPANEGLSVDSVKIEWLRTDADGVEGTKDASDCPTGAIRNTAWSPSDCPFGMLRFDLVAVKGSDTFKSAVHALRNTMTSFVYPGKNSPGTINYAGGANIYGGPASQNSDPVAACTIESCSITISGIGASEVYIRYRMLYVTSQSVIIEGRSAESMEPLKLKDGQAVIDSTGKAQDVLRRVQVRVPLIGMSKPGGGDGVDPFDYAIRTGESICKQFSIAPPPANVFSRHEDSSCN